MIRFVFGFFLFAHWSLAGLASEKFKILERGTKIPLKNINVFVLPQKIKIETNAEGIVDLPAEVGSEFQLVINVSGYKKFEKAFFPNTAKPRILYLERLSYLGYESTVISKVEKRDAQSQALVREEFLKMPGSFGGDPVRAAQNLPGVAQNGASAQVIIQGASPDDTGYNLDGHRVPLLFHFGGLSSIIIPEAVDRVELLPSGYGPEYSKAIGGLINLTTTKPDPENTQGFAYVDLFNAGGLIQGPVQGGKYLFSVRYSYIGEVLKKVAEESDEFQLTSAPSFGDINFLYQKKLNDKNDFKLSSVYSTDKLQLILNRALNDDPALRGGLQNEVQFSRIIPQWSHRFSEQTQLTHSLGLGHEKLFVNVGGRFLEIDGKTLSQRSEVQQKWNVSHQTWVGLDNEWSWTDVGVNLPSTYDVGGVRNPFSVGEDRRFNLTAENAEVGAYLRHEWTIGEDQSWKVYPNLRFDHFTVNNSTQLQPRLQIRKNLSPSTSLHLAAGEYIQPPQPQESSPFYGNKNIRSPRSQHYTFGFTKDLRNESKQGWTLTNNYFYKSLTDLVVPDPLKNYSNGGSGEIYGFEIQGKLQKNEWSGQVVYTYLKSERRIPGFGKFPAEFDQTHNLNLIGSWQGEKWIFGSRLRFVSGNPYTPVTGGVYDADNDVYLPLRGNLYSKRLSDFMQLDFRVDRKVIYDTWILSYYLDVQNVLNRKNAQGLEYSYDYSRKEEVSGLPLIPSFGIRGEF
jgi:hypothetical protein